MLAGQGSLPARFPEYEDAFVNTVVVPQASFDLVMEAATDTAPRRAKNVTVAAVFKIAGVCIEADRYRNDQRRSRMALESTGAGALPVCSALQRFGGVRRDVVLLVDHSVPAAVGRLSCDTAHSRTA